MLWDWILLKSSVLVDLWLCFGGEKWEPALLLLLVGTDVQLLLLPQWKPVGRQTPCYCWAVVGVKAPHLVSTDARELWSGRGLASLWRSGGVSLNAPWGLLCFSNTTQHGKGGVLPCGDRRPGSPCALHRPSHLVGDACYCSARMKIPASHLVFSDTH